MRGFRQIAMLPTIYHLYLLQEVAATETASAIKTWSTVRSRPWAGSRSCVDDQTGGGAGY